MAEFNDNNKKRSGTTGEMVQRQHANATTTPEMREFIRSSDMSVAALARLLKISESTVRKWKKRDTVEDAPHVARHLQTTLTLVQEYVVVALRKSLLLPLDDLLRITQQFINPDVSRAGIARCLKRHGVSRVNEVKENEDFQCEDGIGIPDAERIRLQLEVLPTHESIESDISRAALANAIAKGDSEAVVNVGAQLLPKLGDDPAQYKLFVAHDPATNWVYVDIFEDDIIEASSRYMSYALRQGPFQIRRQLADNYSEFMRRYRLIEIEQIEQIDQLNVEAGPVNGRSRQGKDIQDNIKT